MNNSTNFIAQAASAEEHFRIKAQRILALVGGEYLMGDTITLPVGKVPAEKVEEVKSILNEGVNAPE